MVTAAHSLSPATITAAHDDSQSPHAIAVSTVHAYVELSSLDYGEFRVPWYAAWLVGPPAAPAVAPTLSRLRFFRNRLLERWYAGPWPAL